MICDVFGLVINVPLSYVMVFGKLCLVWSSTYRLAT
jgi:hypothetical protein